MTSSVSTNPSTLLPLGKYNLINKKFNLKQTMNVN